MANVGKNIRILRTKKGMTQDELAEKLFVSRQTVSNYENGKSNPDIDMLMKIAECLDTDANALIYGIPVKPDTKKERIKSLVLLAILVCLGVLLYYLLSAAQDSLRKTFDSFPVIFLHNLVFPCYYLLTGWCIMQTAGCFLHARSFSGRTPQIIHRVLTVVLLGILILILPGCIAMVADSFTLMRLRNAEIDYSFSASYFDKIPVWDYLARHIFYFLLRIPSFLFLVPGAVFWITKPSTKPQKENES